MRLSSANLLLILCLIQLANYCSTDNVTTTTTRPRFGSRRVFTVTTTTTSTTTTEASVGETQEDTTTPTTPAPTKRRTLVRTNRATTTTTASPTSSTSTTSAPTTIRSTTVGPVANCGQRILEKDIHPWIAILEHSDPMNSTRRRTFSKGVLISENYVLTTVSSIHNSHPFWEVTRVRLGDFPVGFHKKVTGYQPEFVEVEEIVFHPKRDIALVKLKRSVEFTDLIQPACLPTSENYHFRELILHVCRKNKNYMPARVSVSSLSVLPISPQDCSTLFHRKGANFNAREEFCTWDERVDTCTDDLGGPLLGVQNNRYHVIGLSSYVTTKRTIRDETLPGIYTRVGHHLKWIEAVLANDNTEVK